MITKLMLGKKASLSCDGGLTFAVHVHLDGAAHNEGKGLAGGDVMEAVEEPAAADRHQEAHEVHQLIC